MASRGFLWICLVLLLSAGPARADDHIRRAPVNIDAAGVAIGGFDPVAYFEVGKKTLGSSAWTAEHGDATYRFSTRARRDRFASDPERFAPRFGGYCAYGVRVGRKFDIDPDAFEIVDDRLYLLLNLGTQVVWQINQDENIEIAHKIWPMIRTKSDTELAEEADKRN